MRRADRLFQIVQYLRGGRLVRARQLSEWLEVSERTIYRDVATCRHPACRSKVRLVSATSCAMAMNCHHSCSPGMKLSLYSPVRV